MRTIFLTSGFLSLAGCFAAAPTALPPDVSGLAESEQCKSGDAAACRAVLEYVEDKCPRFGSCTAERMTWSNLGCEAGDVRACEAYVDTGSNGVNNLYTDQNGEQVTPAWYYRQAERICELPPEEWQEEWEYWQYDPVYGKPPRGLYREGPPAVSGLWCFRLGNLRAGEIPEVTGVAVDEVAAIRAYSRGCRAGSYSACEAGEWMLKRNPSLAPPQALHQIEEDACIYSGAVMQCIAGASRLEASGDGESLREAERLLHSGCILGSERGNEIGCAELHNFSKRQCDKGHMWSCTMLGRMNLNSGGAVPVNVRRARYLFRRACDADEQEACDRLAELDGPSPYNSGKEVDWRTSN